MRGLEADLCRLRATVNCAWKVPAENSRQTELNGDWICARANSLVRYGVLRLTALDGNHHQDHQNQSVDGYVQPKVDCTVDRDPKYSREGAETRCPVIGIRRTQAGSHLA